MSNKYRTVWRTPEGSQHWKEHSCILDAMRWLGNHPDCSIQVWCNNEWKVWAQC